MSGSHAQKLESFLSCHGFAAIDDRADVKIGDETLRDVSPLDVAAWKGQEQTAALLIASEADVNAGSENGRPALHDVAWASQDSGFAYRQRS